MNFKAIEFLRTIASLGVVWVHLWAGSFSKMPLNFCGLDVYKAISFVGNGVDFFFVISGFLMYLALCSRKLTLNSYFYFVKKRFYRIAPLYYCAILIYFVYYKFVDHRDIGWNAVLINASFLNNHFGINIAYTFWSMAVEWLFYLIIPLLFVFEDHKRQMWIFWTLEVVSLIRLYQIESLQVLHTVPNMPMPFFVEFGWGILMAMILTKNNWKDKFVVKQTWLNLCFGFGLLYLGRIMRMTQVVEWAGEFRIVVKMMSGPILTFGFAFIMFMLIQEHGIFSIFVEHRVFQFLGKCSYGIYLWHVLIIELTKGLFDINGGPGALVLAFLLVVGLSIILSWLTYELIEKLYFKSKFSNKYNDEKLYLNE
jgi:peptidoglycan/LPS O-acetylase OafA/YrhL